MQRDVYNDILSIINSCNTRSSIQIIKEKYKELSDDTIVSIYSQEMKKYVKRVYYQFLTPNKIFQIYKRFIAAIEEKKSRIILNLSEEYKFPSSIIGREILRIYLSELNNYRTVSNKRMKDIYRNPSLLEVQSIRNEYVESIKEDLDFGLESENLKSKIGKKYEKILEDKLNELGVVFSNEVSLRTAGYSKTPDIVLEIPIAINKDQIITWIESKALFCDRSTFIDHLSKQLRSYNNLYGRGMVIYWFGFTEEIKHICEFPIIIVDSFPTEIVKIIDIL